MFEGDALVNLKQSFFKILCKLPKMLSLWIDLQGIFFNLWFFSLSAQPQNPLFT